MPTLHLLAAHPSTPSTLLVKLSQHRDEEVRWGAAANRNTPVNVLLQMRTVDRYSTLNEYLARNPAVPQEVLREMLRRKEAALSSVAMNPACPIDVMHRIADHGTDMEKYWLAGNPGLTAEIAAKLERDPSPNVALMLEGNPAYRKWASSREKRP